MTDAKRQPRVAAEYAFHEGVARRQSGELALAAECLRFALTLFTDVAPCWWRPRTLAELAATLDASGEVDEADELRQETLTLCRTLDTDEARTLAAQLASPARPTDGRPARHQ